MTNVGAKTAVATWLAIVTLGVTLLSFGWSTDPNTSMRDTEIELRVLREGPTRQFVEMCRKFEKQRELGVLLHSQETREVWVGTYLDKGSSASVLAPGFEVKGLLWCPYPSTDMTVKAALALLTSSASETLSLWPHSTFLQALGGSIQENRKSENATASGLIEQKFFKFNSLAAEVASGNRISSMEITSDPAMGAHTLFQCSSAGVVFAADDTESSLRFPVQLIISLEEGEVYCFSAKDVPPLVERLYGARGPKNHGLYSSYFGSRMEASLGYSRKLVASPAIWGMPEEQKAADEYAVNAMSSPFDFPAIRSQMKDIGGLTLGSV